VKGLNKAGQGLFDGLTDESPSKLTDESHHEVPGANEPRTLPDESPLQRDPIDPETGRPIGGKPDESPLDLEKLYKTKVHIEDGEEHIAVTVGELKDMYRELHQVKNKASETDKARDEFGREQLLARQEFDAMVAMLPPDALTDEFRASTRERIQQHVRAETVKMLRIVPEWSDPQQADDDRRLINKHAAKYGFSAHEVGLISDHRMLKYLLDNARTEVRLDGVKLKQAETKAMSPTAKPGARSKSDKLADISAAAREGRMSKREAQGQILREALTGGK